MQDRKVVVVLERSGEDDEVFVEVYVSNGGWEVKEALDSEGNEVKLTELENRIAVALASAGMDLTGVI